MKNMAGTLGVEYHEHRKTERALKYRLRRRTREVLRAMRTYSSLEISSLLDIGTADGLMLEELKRSFPLASCIGLEYSYDLLCCKTELGLSRVCGDAQQLPFDAQCMEAVIATAVVEHLPEPQALFAEAYRVLRHGGLLIVTAPDPFWEHLATRLGHLPDEQHHQVMGLSELRNIFLQASFEIVEAEKFMLSPVGMPFELLCEKALRFFTLDRLLANQIVVGQKA